MVLSQESTVTTRMLLACTLRRSLPAYINLHVHSVQVVLVADVCVTSSLRRPAVEVATLSILLFSCCGVMGFAALLQVSNLFNEGNCCRLWSVLIILKSDDVLKG